MLKLFSGLLCFVLFIQEGLGCIPTKPDDGLHIMIPATDVCVNPPWTAMIFIENSVKLEVGPNEILGKKDPVGTCNIHFTNGNVKYYDGRTAADHEQADGNSIGFWDRSNCPNACLCTSTACYQPVPGTLIDLSSPAIYLYPHCNDSMDCFVAVVFYTTGSLVNPENVADKYDTDSQESTNVNDQSYPKVERVGCSGCPVLKQQ